MAPGPDIEAFIAEAIRRDGDDPCAPHNAGLRRGLRDGLQFVWDIARTFDRPTPCHLLALARVIDHMNPLRWRIYDVEGGPPAVKVERLMALWCARLPDWTPEYAYEAFLKVDPFGHHTRWVALVVYQWLRRTWNRPEFPRPHLDGASPQTPRGRSAGTP